MTMGINEIRKARNEAEERIRDALATLEETTGLKVDGVEPTRLNVTFGGDPRPFGLIVGCRIELRVP